MRHIEICVLSNLLLANIRTSFDRISVSVEYHNQIFTYGINGCRSSCEAGSGRD